MGMGETRCIASLHGTKLTRIQRPTFLFQVPISITATVCIHWFSPTAEAKFGGFTLIDKIKMIDWFGIVSLVRFGAKRIGNAC